MLVVTLLFALLFRPTTNTSHPEALETGVGLWCLVATPFLYLLSLAYTLWRYEGNRWIHITLLVESPAAFCLYLLTGMTFGGEGM
jgi:hypothetical protein